jgi:hypothetical protein
MFREMTVRTSMRLHAYTCVHTCSLCSEEVAGCDGVLALLELEECVMTKTNLGDTQL